MVMRLLNRLSLVLFTVMANSAFSQVTILDYENSKFSPATDESFDFALKLDSDASVQIQILNSDHHVVRELVSDGELPAGQHEIVWDGRDSDGDVVADEAYIPVFEAITSDGKVYTLDSRDSGGETVEVKWQANENGAIVYELQQPARVLVRLGIKAGPMLRSLAQWEPRSTGRNVLRWDGFDADGLIDLRAHPDLSVLVTAFNLPDYAVITYGNDREDYRQYLARKQYKPRSVPADKRKLARGDQRISAHHYLSRAADVDPRVSIDFVDRKTDPRAQIDIGDTFEVTVDIHPDDQWIMARSLYEVAFYVNDEFVAEEEHGYVPVNWRWKPTLLEPGRHRLTVNISGFTGQVGVASVEFDLNKRE